MTIVGQTFEGLAQHRQIYRQVNHLPFVSGKNTLPEKEACAAKLLLFIPVLNFSVAVFALPSGTPGSDRGPSRFSST
jgi:hypothetical protein